jgi:hypothetical protein
LSKQLLVGNHYYDFHVNDHHDYNYDDVNNNYHGCANNYNNYNACSVIVVLLAE